jgi:hypothetical protein
MLSAHSCCTARRSCMHKADGRKRLRHALPPLQQSEERARRQHPRLPGRHELRHRILCSILPSPKHSAVAEQIQHKLAAEGASTQHPEARPRSHVPPRLQQRRSNSRSIRPHNYPRVKLTVERPRTPRRLRSSLRR